jgi:hypothetical protein
MNQLSEQKFLKALDICQSLINFKYHPTNLTYEAIVLFCDVAENPLDLLKLCEKYDQDIENLCQIIEEYGTSLDNWRVDCPLGFGIKDHCSFISFFLNFKRHNFSYFTGNFTNPEQIADLFKDYRGLDLIHFIKSVEVNV